MSAPARIPRLLASVVVVLAVSSASAWGKDYRLYVAGGNYQGQLGLGAASTSPAFVQVPGLTDVQSIAAGGMWSMVVTGDGRLWASGLNSEGQLGLGDQTSRTTFTQVSAPANVAAVKAGGNHTLALDDEGNVWSTGYNYYGGLGLGDNGRRTSFQMAPGLTGVEGIAAMAYSSVAWMPNGDIYTTGFNSQGELGQGDYDHRYSFTKINFVQASPGTTIAGGGSHFLVRMYDGTVFVAGHNSMGQLGLGDTNGRNSLTYASSVGGVAGVSGGWVNSLLVKNDGTAMGTGRNTSGELGLGDTTDRNAFTAIPNLTNVMEVAAGSNHSLLIKEDGTLWVAGSGAALGLPKVTGALSAFTRVPDLNHVMAVAAGTHHSLALAPFGVEVTFPSDDGITLERGQKCGITWDSFNLPKGAAVKVELVKGGSETWLLSAAAKKSPLKWTVGQAPKGTAIYPDGADYRIRVSTLDGSDMDESDFDFAIGTVEGLSISGPTDVIGGAAPQQFACTAQFNYGADKDVTALVKWKTDPATYAKMGKEGLLTTRAVAASQSCTLIATYGKGKPPTMDTFGITVSPN